MYQKLGKWNAAHIFHHSNKGPKTDNSKLFPESLKRSGIEGFVYSYHSNKSPLGLLY